MISGSRMGVGMTSSSLVRFGMKHPAARKPRESVTASSKDSRCHYSVFPSFVYSCIVWLILWLIGSFLR